MSRPTSPDGRLTKAERKEQARRERLELQRKLSRGRRNRRISFVLSLAVVAGVVTYVVLRPGLDVPAPGELLSRAAAAKTAAGCDPVENVGPYQPENLDQQHIDAATGAPPLASYATTPPASGPHNEIPLGAGVYDSSPQMDRLIHSLEHGAAVVWYSPDAAGLELDRLREFYRAQDVGARVIVAPYSYPEEGDAGSLPADVEMATVAWHYLQTCQDVSLAAAFDFSARYAAPPFGTQRYLGEAPEAGGQF
jgi:hypothetical protein